MFLARIAGQFWAGAFNQGFPSAKEWIWTDGTPWRVYENWAGDKARGQRYLYYKNAAGGWKSVTSDEEKNFICQYPLENTP